MWIRRNPCDSEIIGEVSPVEHLCILNLCLYRVLLTALPRLERYSSSTWYHSTAKFHTLFFTIECRTKVDSDGSLHHTRRFSTDELQQHRVSNGWVQKIALTCKIHSNGVDRWVGANSTILAKIISPQTTCYNKKRLAKSSTKGTLSLNISDAPPPSINTGTHIGFF